MAEMYEEQSQQMQLVPREELEVEENLLEIINKLITHGIDAGDIKRLQDAGIHTCTDLLMHKKSTVLMGLQLTNDAYTDLQYQSYDFITGTDALPKIMYEKLHNHHELAAKMAKEHFQLLVSDCSFDEQCEQMKLVKGDKVQDEENDVSETIDKLISIGIDARDVKKLLEAGISTCNGLLMHIKKSLTGIKGLSETKFDNICKTVDKIVIPTNMKGENGKAAYINTEGIFRPDLVVLIAEKFGMDATAVLDNARAYKSDHQDYNLLFGLAAKMAEESFQLQIMYAQAYTYEKLHNHLELAAKMAKEPFQLLVSDCSFDEQCEQMKLVKGDKVQDEENDVSETIDKLISIGIDARDVKKLLEAGISTCNDLLMHIKKSLTGIKGLSETKVCKAVDKIVNNGYITGADALLKRNVDELLFFGSKDGAETSEISATFGEFGRTSVCVENGKAAYINTGGIFRPDLVVLIAEKFGMDATAVLDNACAYKSEHQDYNLLFALAAKMAEEPFRLPILDSITALFQVGSSGKGEVAEQQVDEQIESVSDKSEDNMSDDNDDFDEADEEDDLEEGDVHEEDEEEDYMSDDMEDELDGVGPIDIIVWVYDGDEVVEEKKIGTVSYEVGVSLAHISELEDIVEAAIQGSPFLPSEYDIFYQTGKSGLRGDYMDMPTEYFYLIRRLDRILIARPLDDIRR